MDGIDNALELAYEARNWRVMVVAAATKRIAFKGGPGPMNGIAKLELFEAFLARTKQASATDEPAAATAAPEE